MGNFVTFSLALVGQFVLQLAVAARGFPPVLLEAADEMLVVGITQALAQGLYGQAVVSQQLSLGAQELLALDERGQGHVALVVKRARQVAAADGEMLGQHLDGQVGEIRV